MGSRIELNRPGQLAGKMSLAQERRKNKMFDLTPLYRSTVGFDRLANMLDQASGVEANSGYPPFNIESKSENEYRVTMAVAGFSGDELNIEVKENALTVSGKKADTDVSGVQYLHQGIAARTFERRFQLADYVEVTGADLENGLLHIDLKREIPEAMKTRTIKIANGVERKTKKIEQKTAA
jgi:molecular chaperone IbpA